MDLLTLLIIIVIGIIIIRVVGKLLKFAIGIGLVLLIIYVVSQYIDTAGQFL